MGVAFSCTDSKDFRVRTSHPECASIPFRAFAPGISGGPWNDPGSSQQEQAEAKAMLPLGLIPPLSLASPWILSKSFSLRFLIQKVISRVQTPRTVIKVTNEIVPHNGRCLIRRKKIIFYSFLSPQAPICLMIENNLLFFSDLVIKRQCAHLSPSSFPPSPGPCPLHTQPEPLGIL